MSIRISVKNINKVDSIETVQDEDEASKICSNKSIINLPKYMKAKANDLNKINNSPAEEPIKLKSKVLSQLPHSAETSKSGLDEKKTVIDSSPNSREREGSLISIHLNTSSFISIKSSTSNNLPENKICTTKSTNNQNETSENKQTLRTFNEKNVFDEINNAEAEKCMENMENLNNLSNILKNKSTINYNKLMNKNLSSENEFLYKNIVRNEEKNKHHILNGRRTENYLNPHWNKGLNHGFIMEEINNKDYNCIYTHTISHASCSGGKQEQENENENNDSSQRQINKKIEENKLYKISKKMENIKTSYNTLPNNQNGINSGSKNSESYTSNIMLKEDKSGVELTCLQKLCGSGAKK